MQKLFQVPEHSLPRTYRSRSDGNGGAKLHEAFSRFIERLTDAIGILPVRDLANTGNLVLQFASSGPFFGGPGLVLRFASPDAPGTVVANCLTGPSSMALDAKTNTLYVAELGGSLVAVRLVP